jgi:hypothetical protein
MTAFEIYSQKLINARVNHDSNYTYIRAKLAIKRLICYITRATSENKLSLRSWDTSTVWNGKQWVRTTDAKGIYPISLFKLYSCVREGEYAISARIGLRVRDNFTRGFSENSQYTGTTKESKLFFSISRIIYCKLRGYAVYHAALPSALTSYIDEQWNEIYVRKFGDYIQ